MRVVDKLGQILDKSEGEAWQGLVSGQYNLQPGQQVTVRDQAGEVGRVRAEDVGKALRSGYSPAADAEWNRAVLEKKYGGTGDQALAGLAGLARGATVGLSDIPLAALGASERLNAYKEVHPYTSIGGEILGAIAPAFLTEGESALGTAGSVAREASTFGEAARGLGRALTLPSELVSRAGTMASRGTLAALGGEALRTSNLAARVAGRAIPGVVQGTIEGTLQGVGQVISEAALGDPNIAAERTIASGALLGGVLGGAFGLGHALITRDASKLAVRGGEELTKGAVEEVGKEKGWIARFAESRAIKSVDPDSKAITKLDDMRKTQPDAAKLVPDMILGEIPSTAGKGSLATMSRKDIAGTVEKVIDNVDNPRWKSFMRNMGDVAAIEHQPDVIGIVEKIRSDVIDPFSKVGSKAETATLREVADDLLTHQLGAGFEALHDKKVYLGKKIYQTKKASSPLLDSEQKVYAIIEKELMKSAESASEALGGAWKGEYQALKNRWAALQWIQKSAERGAGRLEKTQSFGLGDKLMSIVGAVLGTAGGGTMAGLAVGAAAGAMNNLARARGNQLLAAAASAVAGKSQSAVLNGIKGASLVQARRRTESVAHILGRAERPLLPKGASLLFGDDSQANYERMRDAVLQLNSSPGLQSSEHGHVAVSAPGVANAMTAVKQLQAAYLVSQLPASDRNPDQFGGGSKGKGGGRTKASKSERTQWLRKVSIAEYPHRTILSAKTTRQLSADLSTLREVYPREHQAIVAELRDKLQDENTTPKEAERVRSILGVQGQQTSAKVVQAVAFGPSKAQAAKAVSVNLSRYRSAKDADLENIT